MIIVMLYCEKIQFAGKLTSFRLIAQKQTLHPRKLGHERKIITIKSYNPER